MREASSAQAGRWSAASQRVRSAAAERMAEIRSVISGRESQRQRDSTEMLFERATERRDCAGSASWVRISAASDSEGWKRVSESGGSGGAEMEATATMRAMLPHTDL